MASEVISLEEYKKKKQKEKDEASREFLIEKLRKQGFLNEEESDSGDSEEES